MPARRDEKDKGCLFFCPADQLPHILLRRVHPGATDLLRKQIFSYPFSLLPEERRPADRSRRVPEHEGISAKYFCKIPDAVQHSCLHEKFFRRTPWIHDQETAVRESDAPR